MYISKLAEPHFALYILNWKEIVRESFLRAVYTSLTNSMFMPKKTFIAKKTKFLLEFHT